MAIKKIIILVMLISFIFIIGCNNDDTTTSTPVVTPSVEEDTSDDVIVDVPQKTDEVVEKQISTATNDYDTSKASTDENGCYDSEGGVFYEKKGYIIDVKGDRFEDECVSQTSLSDVYCGPVGYKATSSNSCQYGCENGTCLSGESSPLNCIDSDFKDYYTKGTVNYQGEISTDYCKDNNYLVEFICSIVDVKIQEEKYCKTGCNDGACNEETNTVESTCTDSDLGTGEEFIKGTVTDPKGTVEDECLNSNTVKEYRCGTVGYRTSSNIECDNGCKEGVCVK